jgi:hypothetical protein
MNGWQIMALVVIGFLLGFPFWLLTLHAMRAHFKEQVEWITASNERLHDRCRQCQAKPKEEQQS